MHLKSSSQGFQEQEELTLYNTFYCTLLYWRTGEGYECYQRALTDELQYQREETAARLGRSKGWIISEALNEYMAKEERALNRIENG